MHAVCRALTCPCAAGALRGLLRAGAQGPQAARRARVRPQLVPTQRQAFMGALSTSIMLFSVHLQLGLASSAPRALHTGQQM
jgi:hypothetical protein